MLSLFSCEQMPEFLLLQREPLSRIPAVERSNVLMRLKLVGVQRSLSVKAVRCSLGLYLIAVFAIQRHYRLDGRVQRDSQHRD